MQNHPTEDELVRFCLAQSDDPGASETHVHMERGCRECEALVKELRVVLTSLAAPALGSVPEPMFQRALAWVSAQEQESAAAPESALGGAPAPKAALPTTANRATRRGARSVLRGAADGATRFLEEIHASLIMDSPAGAVLQGIRGSATADARQLFYESPAGSILLLVEPAGAGPIKVRGQFLAADGSAPANGARVVIEVGGGEVVELLSSTGEFRFEGVPPETIRLRVENGALRVVLDPLDP